MARPSIIDTNILIGLIDRYFNEECNGDTSRLKASKIGEYARRNGYDWADYLIRRNTDAMEYMNRLKENNEEVHIHTVSVYRDIDLEAFLQKNNTPEKLKTAIQGRENYYRELARSADYSFKEKKKLEEKIRELQQELNSLGQQLSEQEADNSSLKKENKHYKAENKKLRDIVDTYVYPEVANELLKKDGLIKNSADVVNPDHLEANLVTADSDVPTIGNKVVKGLFDTI